MRNDPLNAGLRSKTLAFAAFVEASTGLAVLVAPAFVADLLLGTGLSAVATVLGRCFGIALLALGIACWPGREQPERGSPALQAMRVYNALIALYLAYLGAVVAMSGLLLWPAVALHAAVALVLTWPVRGGR